ncbi:MAG: YjgN family protein [Geminicoccales bacterium]
MHSDTLVAGIGDFAPLPTASKELSYEALPSAQGRVERFAFTGAGAEYFGIWITNLLLSIVTLGIYSAWAKVRNKQYFYGNTVLDRAAFHFLARPSQILKGRLLVLAFFLAWSVISETLPWFDLVVLLVVIPALVPFAVVRSRKFGARYSAYRHLAFGFDGTRREALVVYVLLSAASVLSAGLLHPYAVYRRKRFQIEHTRFGRTFFSFRGTPRPFYRIYGMAVGLAVPLALISGLLLQEAFGVFTLLAGDNPRTLADAPSSGIILSALAIVVTLASIIAVGIYLQTALANEIWNRTSLGPHRLRLTLEYPRMLWIQLSNAAAIVGSAGLLIPWAQVRAARYKVERLSFLVSGSLDEFVGERARGIGARSAPQSLQSSSSL